MGGWVASVEAWENFSDDWDRELHRAPAIPYFKQKEANSKTEQFAGWAEADINLKTFRLAQVVDRHIDPRRKQYGILTGLKPEVLRILLRLSVAAKKQVRSALKMTEPYDFCFHSVIGMVLLHQHFNLRENKFVDFIFDTHSSFERCEKIHREVKGLMLPELAAIAGTITEGDDKQLAPLQAADLLVGQATKNLKQGKPDKPFLLLARGQRILFAPLRWGEDAALTGFAETLEVFNSVWLREVVGKASRKKP